MCRCRGERCINNDECRQLNPHIADWQELAGTAFGNGMPRRRDPCAMCLYVLFASCPSSIQSVSHRRICLHNYAWYHSEIEAAEQACYLTHSQCTDARPTSPSTDPMTQGVWQGSHKRTSLHSSQMPLPHPKAIERQKLEKVEGEGKV